MRFGRPNAEQLRLPKPAALKDVEAMWLASEVELPAAETDGLLDRLPRLAWVYVQRTGIDHLAVDSFRRRGVAVSNSGTLTTQWVAEMQVACLLSQAKQLAAHRRLQDRHRFRPLWARALTDFRVLVIGTGAIGDATARLCRALGMRVTGASRTPARLAGVAHHFDTIVSLADALETGVREADAVVLCVPLAPGTEGFISDAVMGRMRPATTLVNLARPRLVDEQSLVRRLRDGRLGAAWVSRTETLNLPARLAADRLPNFFLTHVSEAHVESKLRRAFEQFVELSDRQVAGEVGNRVV
jgi:phosphoglycerate dehydrogenase-like enzyme